MGLLKFLGVAFRSRAAPVQEPGPELANHNL